MGVESCSAYVNEVLKFCKALNLTSIHEADVFQGRFIKPSLALSRWMPESGRLLDIGSGMGVPGIPLLMTHPGLRGVLVERRKKRAEFLRHLIRKLGLNAEAHDADIRALEPLGVDVCVARAVTDQAELLAMCAPHMRQGGVAVLPVPSGSRAVDLSGWALETQELLSADGENEDAQLVRCYRYG